MVGVRIGVVATVACAGGSSAVEVSMGGRTPLLSSARCAGSMVVLCGSGSIASASASPVACSGDAPLRSLLGLGCVVGGGVGAHAASSPSTAKPGVPLTSNEHPTGPLAAACVGVWQSSPASPACLCSSSSLEEVCGRGGFDEAGGSSMTAPITAVWEGLTSEPSAHTPPARAQKRLKYLQRVPSSGVGQGAGSIRNAT